MILELSIGCINNDKLSCLERPIATVLSWLNIDYRFIFLSSWTFSYNYMANYQGLQNVPELKALLENSERYTGIRFDVKNIHKDIGNEQICNEIANGKPVIIYIDSYWCPWFPSYQKSHVHHYILIIGVNTDEGYFICLDKLDFQEKVILPFEDYDKGAGEMIFISIENMMDNPPNKMLIKSDCCIALNPSVLQHNIHKFADNVRYFMNVTDQLEDYHDARVSPLYTWLKGICNDRLNFSECLELFLNDNSYGYYKNELKIISDCWRNIIVLLIKIGTRNNHEKSYETIARKIDHIAEKESILMRELKEELLNG